MGEQVLSTVVRLDETETLCIVKPFHNTGCHRSIRKLKKAEVMTEKLWG
jgi:hypothetical protein